MRKHNKVGDGAKSPERGGGVRLDLGVGEAEEALDLDGWMESAGMKDRARGRP